MFKKHHLKIMLFLFIIGISYFSFLHFKIIQYSHTDAPKNADYLIILGTRVEGETPSPLLQKRIDKAAEYLTKNKNTIAIASGGQGPDEGTTEAQAIKTELINQGIEGKRIVLEDQSSRTVENIAFSKKMIPRKYQTGIIVSNYFHIYRARIIAEDQGIKLNSLPAKTPLISAPKWYFREYLAITKYYLERAGFIN